METKKSVLLDRTALLAKEELTIVKVEFEDGSYVFVRQMNGHERDAFEESLLKKIRDKKGAVTGFEQSMADFRAKLAVCTLCDEKGVLLLLPSDVSTLSASMSAKKLDLIVEKASGLNKISDKDKEELVKNSVAGQEDNSGSGFAEN